jgi:hypothetical protein
MRYKTLKEAMKNKSPECFLVKYVDNEGKRLCYHWVCELAYVTYDTHANFEIVERKPKYVVMRYAKEC